MGLIEDACAANQSGKRDCLKKRLSSRQRNAYLNLIKPNFVVEIYVRVVFGMRPRSTLSSRGVAGERCRKEPQIAGK